MRVVRREAVAESVIRVGGYNLWTVGFHERDRRVPLGWRYNPGLDAIDIGGRDFARTRGL